MPLLLEIVTPDATVYSETVDEVGLPTTEGRVHILPHHLPIIAKLDAGDIAQLDPRTTGERAQHDVLELLGRAQTGLGGDGGVDGGRSAAARSGRSPQSRPEFSASARSSSAVALSPPFFLSQRALSRRALPSNPT